LQGIIDMIKHISELLSLFELYKWKSNIIMEQDDVSDQDNLLNFSKDQESKLLGILWNPNEDILYYKNSITKIYSKYLREQC